MPGPKYVSDFSFPSDKGFSGSAGVQHVAGYARGGRVKKAEGGAVSDADRAYLDRSVPTTMSKAQSPMRNRAAGAVSDADRAYMGKAHGGRVKMVGKASGGAMGDLDGGSALSAPAAMPMRSGAPMGALAMKGPKGIKKAGRPKGSPNMAARARTPGGLKEGGKASDAAQDKKAIASAVHKHEKAAHPGKPMTKLRRGGVPSYRSSPLIGD